MCMSFYTVFISFTHSSLPRRDSQGLVMEACFKDLTEEFTSKKFMDFTFYQAFSDLFWSLAANFSRSRVHIS